MKKHALYIGCGFSDIAMIQALQKRDIHVSVCGNDPALPGFKIADHGYTLDYSDVQGLTDLIETEKFDYLVPSGNDCSYNAAHHIIDTNQFGFSATFPGFANFQSTRILHEKNLFREFAAGIDLPIPRFRYLDRGQVFDYAEWNTDVLIKPTNSFSGRGIRKCCSQYEIDLAQQENKNFPILVEEFIEGSLHSHSAFIEKGRIKIDFFVDEFCTVHPYQVNVSNHPSRLRKSIHTKMRDAANTMIVELKLDSGLLHTQFIEQNGNIYIIETTRRAPGDLYHELIRKSTTDHYADYYISAFIGETIQTSNQDLNSKTVKHIARITLSEQNDFTFSGFSCEFPKEHVEFIPAVEKGAFVKSAPYGRCGIAFLNELPANQNIAKLRDQFKIL